MHACRPMDSPLHLAYVATAPTPAANLFDLVVSASSIFAGFWESGAGAIAAENQALAWLAELAGFPPTPVGASSAVGRRPTCRRWSPPAIAPVERTEAADRRALAVRHLRARPTPRSTRRPR